MVLDCELVLRAAHASDLSDAGLDPQQENSAVGLFREGPRPANQDGGASLTAPRTELPAGIAALPLPRRVDDEVRRSAPRQLFPTAAPPMLYRPPGQSRPPAPALVRPQNPKLANLPSSTAAGSTTRPVAVFAQPPNSLSDLELMKKLNHPDETMQARVVRELRQRGYQAVHLNIARLMFHPDPGQRAKLAESLPKIPGIDARPWLLQLSRDSNPALRRRVATILATANDPIFRRRLQEMQREETDRQTADLVREILNR